MSEGQGEDQFEGRCEGCSGDLCTTSRQDQTYADGTKECTLPVAKARSLTTRSQTSCSDLDLRLCSSGPDCAVGEDVEMKTLKSFVLAVHEKYAESTGWADAEEMVLLPRAGPVKMTDSGSIVLPKQVTMSGCEISVAGDPALVHKMCQKVHELDLTENNIERWEEVFALVRCIPNLTFLNLTKNHMSGLIPELDGWSSTRLSHLVLNNTLVTWDVLVNLLRIFPCLQELHLSLNQYKHVDFSSELGESPALTSYPSLRRLFFASSHVREWSELAKLGKFFSGVQFILFSDTNIETLGDATDAHLCFPSLNVLGLSRTRLQSWDEIEKLRHFPSLTDVRLSGIPFLESLETKLRRWHTVALLPNIVTLNGSVVCETEREDAERSYIRLYMESPDKPSRWHELEQRHGQLQPLVEVELTPKKTVRLTVKVENCEGELQSTHVMDIVQAQTIRELKRRLSHKAGCPSAKFQLFYLDLQSNYGQERLQYMERKVHSYQMKDGDELIVAFKKP